MRAPRVLFRPYCGSISFPLYRNTVLRAITRSFGICETLLMILSVMPSPRYSLFASPLALANGRTASELIAFRRLFCLGRAGVTIESSDATAPLLVWT